MTLALRLSLTSVWGSQNEDHDRSTEMSQGFLNLKRDVEDFVVRFDAWIEKTGTELQERAKQLQGEINDLKTVIER